VYVGRYATEQTYDTRRWQILEHKARGIEQLRNFDGTINEIDDIDGEAANSADMKAAASGDPLILEETKRKADVRRLEQLQASHADEIVSMTRHAQRSQEQADTYYPAVVKKLSELIATTAKNKVVKGVFTPIKVNGKEILDKELAEKEVGSAATMMRASTSSSDAATINYRGLEFVIFSTGGGNIKAESPTGNLGQWNFQEPFSSSGFIQRMVNYVDRLPAAIEGAIEEGKKSAADAQAMREQAAQPFGQAADLEKAREDYRAVQRALLSKGPEVPAFQKKAVADGIKSQKAKLRAMGFGPALREFMGEDAADKAPTPAGSTNLSQTGAPEANDADVVFSRGAPAKGIPTATAKQITDAISARWTNAPEIVVVADMQDADIPARVREEDAKQRSQGAERGARRLLLRRQGLHRGWRTEQPCRCGARAVS